MTCPRGCCASMKEHLRSVSLATSGELVRVNRADDKVARDLVSYKALVDQGYEPYKCTGAYELARDAKSAAEIEGRLPLEIEEI